jgi:hypothetical protein
MRASCFACLRPLATPASKIFFISSLVSGRSIRSATAWITSAPATCSVRAPVEPQPHHPACRMPTGAPRSRFSLRACRRYGRGWPRSTLTIFARFVLTESAHWLNPARKQQPRERRRSVRERRAHIHHLCDRGQRDRHWPRVHRSRCLRSKLLQSIINHLIFSFRLM